MNAILMLVICACFYWLGYIHNDIRRDTKGDFYV